MTGDAPSPGQSPGPADEPRTAAPAAPLALYRRYRPASFAEVKGQDHVTEPLRQALRSGRVNHAYLFSGPRGCGKTSSARILARSLNCESGPTPDPCGVCDSCVALAPAGPGSIDVIEIDAASHGGVDDARDLRERAFYAPVAGRFKIYIIDEAHMVTREGFNALLKLVEEPPPHLKFVFATTEPEKVIATIRSRTHHYPFRLVPPAVLRELLEQILGSEGVAYEPTVLPVVIRAGAGSVRDSLSVLDQLIAGSDEAGLTYARAVRLLGYTDDRLLDEVAQAFAARDGAAVFGAINRVVEAGHDPRRFAADLLDRLRDLIVLAAVPDAVSTGLLDVPADRLDEMRAQAEGFGQAELTRAAEIVSTGLVEMRGATSPRLLLELMCAQVLVPGSGAGSAELISRVERLERRLESGVVPIAGPGVRPETARPEIGQPEAARPPSAPAPSTSVAPDSAEPAQAGHPNGQPAASQPEPSQPEPSRSVPSQPAPAAPTPTPSASSQPAPSQATGGQVDTTQLQSRWPDVLEAVRGERKVAWILLTNATVKSLLDGALTVEFAREGDAKGFVSSGCDAVLGSVLQAMFGISPQLKTTVRTPGSGPGGPAGSSGSGGPGTSGPGAPGGAGGAGRTARGGGSGGADGWGAGQAGAGQSGAGQDSRPQGAASWADSSAQPGNAAQPGNSSQAGNAAQATGTASSAAGNAAQAAGTNAGPTWAEPSAAWDDPAPGWDDDPRDDEGDYDAGPSGPPDPRLAGPVGSASGSGPGLGRNSAPGALSGMDLIERELGGRIIQDLGDA